MYNYLLDLFHNFEHFKFRPVPYEMKSFCQQLLCYHKNKDSLSVDIIIKHLHYDSDMGMMDA